MGGGVRENTKMCGGGIRGFFFSPSPLRISNGMARSEHALIRHNFLRAKPEENPRGEKCKFFMTCSKM